MSSEEKNFKKVDLPGERVWIKDLEWLGDEVVTGTIDSHTIKGDGLHDYNMGDRVTFGKTSNQGYEFWVPIETGQA